MQLTEGTPLTAIPPSSATLHPHRWRHACWLALARTAAPWTCRLLCCRQCLGMCRLRGGPHTAAAACSPLGRAPAAPAASLRQCRLPAMPDAPCFLPLPQVQRLASDRAQPAVSTRGVHHTLSAAGWGKGSSEGITRARTCDQGASDPVRACARILLVAAACSAGPPAALAAPMAWQGATHCRLPTI